MVVGLKITGKNKMEVGELYQFVLLIVLVGMILGVGILVIDKFASSSSMSTNANGSLNNISFELGKIASDWMGLIITIAILAIILTLVIRSFAQQR